MSKVLPADVVTKFLALMSAVESLCPLLAPLVYSTLYGATVSTAPASVYVLSTGIIVFCIVLIGYVFLNCSISLLIIDITIIGFVT